MSSTDPDWRDLIDDELDIELHRPPRRSIGINFRQESYLVVRDAADSAGISMAAYVRLAALGFAAHELGLSLEDVVSKESQIRDRSGTAFVPIVPDDWKIERLGDRNGDDGGRVRRIHEGLDSRGQGRSVEGVPERD